MSDSVDKLLNVIDNRCNKNIDNKASEYIKQKIGLVVEYDEDTYRTYVKFIGDSEEKIYTYYNKTPEIFSEGDNVRIYYTTNPARGWIGARCGEPSIKEITIYGGEGVGRPSPWDKTSEYFNAYGDGNPQNYAGTEGIKDSYSTAKGYVTSALGKYCATEGALNTIDSKSSACHAEGYQNSISYSAETAGTNNGSKANHVEGYTSKLINSIYSHVEGWSSTLVCGKGSHVEGYGCTIDTNKSSDSIDISLEGSHAEGAYTGIVDSNYAHTEGYAGRIWDSDRCHVEGSHCWIKESSTNCHAEGYGNEISNSFCAHAEGSNQSITNANQSHAEGFGHTVTAAYSHAEGYACTVSGENSHAEGYACSATNSSSHAEGSNNNATGDAAHAEGRSTTASGAGSHAEGGYGTTAEGESSHAENFATHAIGNYSHAGGIGSAAIGVGDFVHGQNLQTSSSGSYRAVFGKYNDYSDDNIIFSIGNGNSGKRSNAFAVDVDGNIYCSGIKSTGDNADEFIPYTSDQAITAATTTFNNIME